MGKETAEPTVKNLRELAIIFGISVDDLLDDSVSYSRCSSLCVSYRPIY